MQFILTRHIRGKIVHHPINPDLSKNQINISGRNSLFTPRPPSSLQCPTTPPSPLAPPSTSPLLIHFSTTETSTSTASNQDNSSRNVALTRATSSVTARLE